ncbi:MAG: NADPH:quinone oxidoreductase family protein [Gammaproteobacteria bacterium]|nr:NADPH:quinone oxidoreductase family protein [Gammaproteobacteria bacterium]
MRAIVCRDFSKPLQVETVDDPAPGPDDVLIEVGACGVNFVDGLIVTGKYQIKPDLPYVAGFEVAGTVRACGANVSDLTVGQSVFATTGLGGGGYAELASVSRDQVFALPQALTLGQGATFVQSYCTALFSLRYRMQLGPGQTLLVLGASGGVGRAAVDIGKALGANVIAAASSAERLEACASLKPDGVINYSRDDIKTQARTLTNGKGVDAVYDPLGGEYSEPALRALGDDGTFLVIGFAAGSIPKLPTNQVLLRNRRVVGVDWGGWRTHNPGLQSKLMNELAALVDAGKLDPQQPKEYALEAATEALRAVNEREVVGKVALIP